jgi:hypothetical protein
MFCPFTCAHDGSSLVLGKQICRALTLWSNGPGRNRHPERNFSKKLAQGQFLDSRRQMVTLSVYLYGDQADGIVAHQTALWEAGTQERCPMPSEPSRGE